MAKEIWQCGHHYDVIMTIRCDKERRCTYITPVPEERPTRRRRRKREEVPNLRHGWCDRCLVRVHTGIDWPPRPQEEQK